MAVTLVVSRDEAKRHAGIPANQTDVNEDVDQLLATAQEMIEARVGPLVQRPVTVRVAGASGRLELPLNAPVAAITSITAADGSGGVVATSGLLLDGDTATVRVISGAFIASAYSVTVTAGWGATVDDVPDALKTAVKEQFVEVWSTSRGVGARTANERVQAARGNVAKIIDTLLGAGFA